MPMTAPCGQPWTCLTPMSRESASQAGKIGADLRPPSNHPAFCHQMRDIIEQYRELRE